MTIAARELVERATTARLRTRRHPAASAFPGVESFDELYEAATDFEALYQSIADELVRLANGDAHGSVVFAVPGSPSVAERTVSILAQRDDVDLVLVPGLSFVDLACVALSIDPVAAGLRVGDALDLPDRLRGPGARRRQRHRGRAAPSGAPRRARRDAPDRQAVVVPRS
jgi:tetrapyrrole methylase family protein/MazG family protein